jgi:uncharacterized membrane protein
LERHGDQVELIRAEMAYIPAYDLFIDTADHFAVPKERQGVPFVVVGDQVMIGSDEIDANLANAVEQGLAEGGSELPPELGVSAELAATLNSLSDEAWGGEHKTDGVANTAALVILSLMGLSLVYAGGAVTRAPTRPIARAIAELPSQESLFVPVLAIAGLGVSGYLSYVELTGSDTVCPIGRCEVVQHSPYSSIMGVPVAALGFLAYLAIIALWAWGRHGRDRLANAAPLLIFTIAFVGTAFSAYLTFLEPFVIKAVCIWCLASAVIITLIMLVALRWILPGGDHTGSEAA